MRSCNAPVKEYPSPPPVTHMNLTEVRLSIQGDSDNSNSFQYNSDIKYSANIEFGVRGILTVKVHDRVGILTKCQNSLGQPGDSHWQVHNLYKKYAYLNNFKDQNENCLFTPWDYEHISHDENYSMVCTCISQNRKHFSIKVPKGSKFAAIYDITTITEFYKWLKCGCTHSIVLLTYSDLSIFLPNGWHAHGEPLSGSVLGSNILLVARTATDHIWNQH